MIETNWLTTLLLLGAVQGLFMSYLLWRKKWENAPAVKLLVSLLILISALMFGRIALTIPGLSDLGALIVLPDVILFLVGPCLYFFTRSLLYKGLPPRPAIYWHFLPAFIHVFILNTIVACYIEDFWVSMERRHIIQLFLFIEGAAIISMVSYLVLSIRYFKNYKTTFYQQYAAPLLDRFLTVFCMGAALVLGFWTVGFVRNFILPQPDFTIYMVVWFSLVLMVYALASKVLLSPSILELSPLETEATTTGILVEAVPPKAIAEIEAFMQNEKPFLNAELKIGDLAEMMDIPQYELSRRINQGFQKNFFDFINHYRVGEFIQLKQDPQNEAYNILELAFQSGFNSKSAFNRAFRKTTGQSPRNYFKTTVTQE